jgi:hypothetical protein
MIKLRIDVDYPYPSRLKSFLCTAFNIRMSKRYLRNAKIIARMINESRKEVKAYWFFTPQTIPDKELLELLDPSRHEIALHVAKNPYAEWKFLESATNRKVNYYTVHGTARLLARLMWRRRLWEDRVRVPKELPLKSFYDFPTIGIDVMSYTHSTVQVARMAKMAVARGDVLHIHPIWLFQRGKINRRGPYYEALRTILEID